VALAVAGRPRVEVLLPLLLGLLAAVDRGPGVGEDLVGDLEGLLGVEAEDPLGRGDLVLAQGGAVRLAGALRVGRGPGDDRAEVDEARCQP
jgi:hypothetical protein